MTPTTPRRPPLLHRDAPPQSSREETKGDGGGQRYLGVPSGERFGEGAWRGTTGSNRDLGVQKQWGFGVHRGTGTMRGAEALGGRFGVHWGGGNLGVRRPGVPPAPLPPLLPPLRARPRPAGSGEGRGLRRWVWSAQGAGSLMAPPFGGVAFCPTAAACGAPFLPPPRASVSPLRVSPPRQLRGGGSGGAARRCRRCRARSADSRASGSGSQQSSSSSCRAPEGCREHPPPPPSPPHRGQ